MSLILDYIFGVAMAIMSFVFIISICNMFLTHKKINKISYVIWGGLFLILSIIHFSVLGNRFDLLLIIFAIIYISLIYEDKKRYKAFVILITLLSVYIFEILLQVGISLMFDQYYMELQTKNYEFYVLMLNIIEIISVLIFIYLKRKRIISGKIELQKINLHLMRMFVFITILTMVYINFVDNYFSNMKDIEISFSTTFLVFTMFMGIIIVIALIVLIQNNIREKMLEKTNRILEEHINSQLNYYNQLEKNLIDTRKIKHDMRNHMFCLKHLIETKSMDNAIEYIEEIENRSNAIVSSIETGNSIFDAILNEKSIVAKENNIDIVFRGNLPKYNFIDLIDIVTITTNSIDNAIEAYLTSEESKKRVIEIETFIKQGHWIYKITNISNVVHISKNNLIKTTKKNKESHGFGLINIRETVKKYNGDFSISYKDGYFSLEVIIKENSNSHKLIGKKTG